MCSLGSDGHISIYKLNIIIERVDTFADAFAGAFAGAFVGAFVGAFADKGKVEDKAVVVEDNTVAGSSAAADKD